MKKSVLGKGEKSLLLNHLTGILSMTREDVDDLIMQFPHEAEAIARVFLHVSVKVNREWSEYALVKVPFEMCVIENNQLLSFDERLGGSLRFLMKKNFLDEDVEVFADQLDSRLELCYLLVKALDQYRPSSHRALYVDMLTWDERIKGEYGDRGLNFDVKLGHAIQRMENYFERLARFINSNLREGSIFSDLGESLVGEERGYFYALQEMDGYFSNGYFNARRILWSESCLVGGDHACDSNYLTDRDALLAKWHSLGDVRDSLLVRVVANMSANRAILEHNFFIGLQRSASAVMVSFLSKLKPLGWEEVMWDFFERQKGIYSSDDNIFRFLRMHFGQNGIFVGFFNFGNRYMSDWDLDLAVKWSFYLQDQYIKNRGNNGDIDLSREQHGSLNNRMIFALVIVAAFFEKVKVPREFVGQRNSTYSVFPAPGQSPDRPGHNAEEFLHIAYGQVYFGNTGWKLLPDGIPAYAESTIKKRVAMQHLAWYLVKGLTAPKILKNYIAIECLDSSDKSWVDNL